MKWCTPYNGEIQVGDLVISSITKDADKKIADTVTETFTSGTIQRVTSHDLIHKNWGSLTGDYHMFRVLREEKELVFGIPRNEITSYQVLRDKSTNKVIKCYLFIKFYCMNITPRTISLEST